MDRQLMEAVIAGDVQAMCHLASENPALLHGTTTHGNTWLHVSSIHGQMDFCAEVLDQYCEQSLPLLSVVNNDRETPLITAVVNGHDSLAFVLLKCYRDHRLDTGLRQQDRHECNVLHHAIHSGYKKLALELIEAEPALSRHTNRFNESPMFMAVLRGYTDVLEELLKIPGSEDSGTYGYNALHVAVKHGNEDIATKIIRTRPGLARNEDNEGNTPLHLTAHFNRVSILTRMLECDCSLGYITSGEGPLLFIAAKRGHVDFARVLLKHCPDAPYADADGMTCLHEAIIKNRMEFVEFILGEPKLWKLVNLQNQDGESALHLAVRKCDPKMVTALLGHPAIDVTAINNAGCSAVWKLNEIDNHAKTVNWNKIVKLILKADDDDKAKADIYNLHEEIKNKVIDATRNDVKSLTETYTSNTSLVAILIAAITFTAAFTLPGGYSNDAGSEGLPIMARKVAFQAFIIFDTLGMCSSLAVAFICVTVRLMDFEFLVHYRDNTKILMWFAYTMTALAFGTGLYTVLAPRIHWLAIAVCIVSALLPILTMLLGEWPVLKLKHDIQGAFDSTFLHMV